jgi:hypothetical protein
LSGDKIKSGGERQIKSDESEIGKKKNVKKKKTNKKIEKTQRIICVTKWAILGERYDIWGDNCIAIACLGLGHNIQPCYNVFSRRRGRKIYCFICLIDFYFLFFF